jgi:3-oxoacyl-[acyl-carrier-protein] synthase II
MGRVVITGMGINSPIGNSIEEVQASLLEGRSGITAVPEWRSVRGLKTLVAGRVTGLDPKTIARTFRRTMGPVSVLAAFAARDALAQAGIAREMLAGGHAGVAFGSTIGSPAVLQQFFGDFAVGGIEGQEGTMFMKVMSHTVAANVAAMLDVRGRLLATCSACASSAQAIGAGFEAVQEGREDIMICGGAEELHATTAGVFDILSAASRGYNDAPSRTPRPFDRDRDGLVVAEGAGAVVLEDYDHAVARGARIYAEVLGYATTCDGANMALADADGMAACMKEAIRSAGIAPEDLDYVNAHATGTVAGDAAEADAMRRVVGAGVPVSSTKGYTGHTLAACGAMEVIFSALMMDEGFITPTLNLDNVDEACGGLAHVRSILRKDVRLVLSNNFAFGGVNASLVLARR